MPSSIAPLISGWQRRVGGLPGPYSVMPATGVASGGTGVNGVLVELLVDGSWVDITSRVMVRDTSGQISITRGQSSEGQTPNPGTCSFQLNNRDGLFSPANPVSPYYGKIGRNTQVRVSVAKGDDKSYRFWGEITAWPEDWDNTGTDIWVDVEAAGILKRLNQGSTPLRSTMYRALMSAATTAPVAYWPCEDGSSATSLASAVGGTSMTFHGSPTLAADNGFLGSAALPVMASAALVGSVPAYTGGGVVQLRFLMYLPTAPPDGTQLVKIAASGTIPYWAVAYNTGGSLALRGLDTDGLTVLVSSGPIAFNIDAKRVLVSMELSNAGLNLSWAMRVMDTSGTVSSLNNTFSTQNIGRVTSVTVCPGQTISDGVVGHISVLSAITSMGDLGGPMTGYVGESPSSRISRLCAENSVNEVNFSPGSTDAMGPQLPNTLLSLLQECVDVDQGVLMEREVAFGLAYKSRAVLYDQGAQLTLSYPGHQLSAVPRPVPDDQTVRNSITATRPSGSSATATLATGALSTQDPPNGVGTYPDNPTLNVESDDDLPQHAQWRLHLGTVDEPRYPAISINLAHPAMASLRLAALNTLFGSRVVVQSPPSRLGGDISQLVIGIQETITHFEHRITFVCQPESPYRVATLDDTVYGRLDTDTSQLAADMTPTQTTVQVSSGTGPGPLWTADPADYPFDLAITGEQVTAVAAGAVLNVVDGTFESGVTGWTATSATLTQSTVQAHTGTASGLLTVTGTPTQAFARPDSSHYVPVTAGAEYRCSLWVYAPVALSAVQVAVDWLDSTKVYLSTSSGTSTAVAAGTWTLLTVTATAPGTAGYLRGGPTITGSPAAGTQLYMDDLVTVATSTYLSSPQTLTVARSVNGIVKSHQAGESVSLADSTVVAL